MKNFMKKRLNKKGFTLVELIVVIAIVAVLAVIGIPAIAGQVSKAKISTLTANAASVASQAGVYITSKETSGSGITALAAADETAILTAAGVNAAKYDVAITTATVGANTFAPVDANNPAVSCKVTKVTVVEKGKTPGTDLTGEWNGA